MSLVKFNMENATPLCSTMIDYGLLVLSDVQISIENIKKICVAVFKTTILENGTNKRVEVGVARNIFTCV